MTFRLHCCVPHCKRTLVRDVDITGREWMCGDHWRLNDQRRRQAYGRHVRVWRRFSPPAGVEKSWRLWRALKRTATEKAMGIS